MSQKAYGSLNYDEETCFNLNVEDFAIGKLGHRPAQSPCYP